MKTPINDIARLQNTVDGLEKLILESTLAMDVLDPSEQRRTETAMQHIFAASAARAKLAVDDHPTVATKTPSSKAKRPNPLAVRLHELAIMLQTRPDIEPRLRAVFESSPNFDDAEIDKIINDVGTLLSQQDNLSTKAKSKKPKGS